MKGVMRWFWRMDCGGSALVCSGVATGVSVAERGAIWVWEIEETEEEEERADRAVRASASDWGA